MLDMELRQAGQAGRADIHTILADVARNEISTLDAMKLIADLSPETILGMYRRQRVLGMLARQYKKEVDRCLEYIDSPGINHTFGLIREFLGYSAWPQ